MTATQPQFDRSAVGQWSDPQEFTVTQKRIAQFAAATNDHHPLHRSGELAPPVFAIVPAFWSLGAPLSSVVPGELLPMVLHGEHDFRYHRPIVPGLTLISSAAVTGFRTTSSGAVVAVTVRSSDAGSDELVVAQTATMFYRGGDAGEPAGEMPTPHSFPAVARTSQPVASTSQRTDPDQTYRYAEAAGDPMPIHLDAEFARNVGLPGIIVHGMCTLAFVSQLIIETAALDDPRRLTRLAVRFSRVLQPEQEFTTAVWTPAGDHEHDEYVFETRGPEGLILKDGLADVRR